MEGRILFTEKAVINNDMEQCYQYWQVMWYIMWYRWIVDVLEKCGSTERRRSHQHPVQRARQNVVCSECISLYNHRGWAPFPAIRRQWHPFRSNFIHRFTIPSIQNSINSRIEAGKSLTLACFFELDAWKRRKILSQIVDYTNSLKRLPFCETDGFMRNMGWWRH